MEFSQGRRSSRSVEHPRQEGSQRRQAEQPGATTSNAESQRRLQRQTKSTGEEGGFLEGIATSMGAGVTSAGPPPPGEAPAGAPPKIAANGQLGEDFSVQRLLVARPEAIGGFGLGPLSPAIGVAASEALRTGEIDALRDAGLSKEQAAQVFNAVSAVAMGTENETHTVDLSQGSTVINDNVGRDEIVLAGVKSFDDVTQTRDGDDLIIQTATGSVRVPHFYDPTIDSVERIVLGGSASTDHGELALYREEMMAGTAEEKAEARDAAMESYAAGEISDTRAMMFGATNKDDKQLTKGMKKVAKHHTPGESYGEGKGADLMAQADQAKQELAVYGNMTGPEQADRVKLYQKKGKKKRGFLSKALGVVGMVAPFFPGIGTIIGAVANGLNAVVNGGSIWDGIKAGVGSYLTGGGVGKGLGNVLARTAGAAMTGGLDSKQLVGTLAGAALGQSQVGEKLGKLGVTVDGNGVSFGTGPIKAGFDLNGDLRAMASVNESTSVSFNEGQGVGVSVRGDKNSLSAFTNGDFTASHVDDEHQLSVSGNLKSGDIGGSAKIGDRTTLSYTDGMGLGVAVQNGNNAYSANTEGGYSVSQEIGGRLGVDVSGNTKTGEPTASARRVNRPAPAPAPVATPSDSAPSLVHPDAAPAQGESSSLLDTVKGVASPIKSVAGGLGKFLPKGGKIQKAGSGASKGLGALLAVGELADGDLSTEDLQAGNTLARTAAGLGGKAAQRFVPGLNAIQAGFDIHKAQGSVRAAWEGEGSVSDGVFDSLGAIASVVSATNIPVVSQVGAAAATGLGLGKLGWNALMGDSTSSQGQDQGKQPSAPFIPNGIAIAPTGLGDDIDAIASRSPTLLNSVSALQADGWVIERGESGNGTYASGASKTITIDADLGTNEVVLALAHEALHANSTEAHHDAATSDVYVDRNVQESLNEEAFAAIHSFQVHDELMAGDTTIDIGQAYGRDYQRSVWDAYRAGQLSREEMIDQIAQDTAATRTSTTQDLYSDYYGDIYQQNWERQHPRPDVGP